MNLLLWRHAEAVDGSPDLERALTVRGRNQAQRIAAWLAPLLDEDARILASPAKRTRETADCLERPFRVEGAIAPGAEPEAILEVVSSESRSLPADGTLVLVGHQPWIGETAALLISGLPSPWSVRKAALWWLVQRARAGTIQWTIRAVRDAEHP